MRFNSKALPENILRCMPTGDRKPLGKAGVTQDEADQKQNRLLEKELQENIASLLRQRDIVFFQQRMDRKTTGTVGWPDFSFAINGKACGVEVKRPGCQPTADQMVVLAGLKRCGWNVQIVRSEVEFLEFINTLCQT